MAMQMFPVPEFRSGDSWGCSFEYDSMPKLDPSPGAKVAVSGPSVNAIERWVSVSFDPDNRYLGISLKTGCPHTASAFSATVMLPHRKSPDSRPAMRFAEPASAVATLRVA